MMCSVELDFLGTKQGKRRKGEKNWQPKRYLGLAAYGLNASAQDLTFRSNNK